MAGANNLATISENSYTYLNWDGHALAWYQAEHGLEYDESPADTAEGIPPLRPEGLPESVMNGAIALWPLEAMLLRCLHLPLKSVSLLDADMLRQELADRVGVDPESWWLCWDFQEDPTGGIRGMVFGIPETLRQNMANTNDWQQLAHLGVDGWHRLKAHARDDCAIIEQDCDGLFLGVYIAGCWHGMRRINGNMDTALWVQVMASLKSMGFDAETHSLCGQIDGTILPHIQAVDWSWQGTLLDALIPRYHANLRCMAEQTPLPRTTPNFRRGHWAARGSWQAFRPWLRSIVLVAVLGMIMLFAQLQHISDLKKQGQDAESRIVAAFHQGLPDEPVMLDALAQLRQAAGQQGKTAEQSRFLLDLQAISRSYQQHAWVMKSLVLQRKKMQLAGKIDDVKSLNQLQHTLEKEMGHPVRIADTNLGNQVSFRLEWTWQ